MYKDIKIRVLPPSLRSPDLIRPFPRQSLASQIGWMCFPKGKVVAKVMNEITNCIFARRIAYLGMANYELVTDQGRAVRVFFCDESIPGNTKVMKLV